VCLNMVVSHCHCYIRWAVTMGIENDGEEHHCQAGGLLPN
jgi:hypothetical protein